MPKFSGKITILDFTTPSNKITNALLESVRRVLVEGLVVFLEAAIRRIPIDTGMSQGSMLPLAKVLQKARAPGAFFPSIIPKSTNKKYALGGLKSIARGESLGSPTTIDEIITIEKASGRIKFNYKSNVFHFNLNELFPLRSNRGVPWNSFAYGLTALKEFLNRNLLNKVPNLVDFADQTTYTVSGPRFSRTTQKLYKGVI